MSPPRTAAPAGGGALGAAGTRAWRAATGAIALLAVALGVALLARPANFSLNDDNATLTHPLLLDAWRQLRAGHLPVWTTGRWGGSPLLGDPVVGALYAPYALSYALAGAAGGRALDVAVALHLVWLALGTAWLLRALGVRPLVAIVGTALLLLNPSLAFMARGWIQYWAAFSWWPWLFGAAVRLARSPTRRDGALAAAALAAQVYAGYPQFALHSGLAALGWIALRRPLDWRGWATAAVVGLGGVGLAAPQILPGLAMARDSIRSGSEGRELLAAMDVFSLSAGGWGQVLGASAVNLLVPYRLAPAVVGLAVVGAARGRFEPIALAATALLAASLATAGNPLHGVLHDLPLFSGFGAPQKFAYLVVFATSLLAALGLERILTLGVRGHRACAAGLAASLAGALAALVPGAWLPLVGVTALAAGLAPRRALPAAIAGLAVAASALGLWASHPLAERFAFGSGRFRPLLFAPPPSSWAGRTATRPLALDGDRDLRQIGVNYGSLWGIEAWNGVGPLARRRQLEVMERLDPTRAAEVARQLGAAPVLVVAGGAAEAALLAAGYDGPPPAAGIRALFPQVAAPRYELAPEVRFVSEDEARSAARRGDALGAGAALLERPLGSGAVAPPGVEPAPPRSMAGDPDGRLAVLASRPGAASLAVDVDRATWLVAREPLDAAWRVTIDGAPAEVVPAASFLQAVLVPAGHHEVSFAIEEPHLGIGLALALAAAALLTVALGALARASRPGAAARAAAAPPR